MFVMRRAGENGAVKVENHRIVGCGPEYSYENPGQGRTGYEIRALSRLDFSDDPDKRRLYHKIKPQEDDCLSAMSYEPLELLYAQEMFSAFMWAVAKALPEPFEKTLGLGLLGASSNVYCHLCPQKDCSQILTLLLNWEDNTPLNTSRNVNGRRPLMRICGCIEWEKHFRAQAP
jgi:hypothetical protein